MAVHFDSIKIGTKWDRNQLARLWGYKSFHAIARGVVTPAHDKKIILFVTEEKQEGLTQYADRLCGRTLEWEGEEGHASDRRIADSAIAGDEIHIFYRKRHHAPFTYLGIGTLVSYSLIPNAPSKFVFKLSQ
jgi:hypothetical protein